MKKQYAILLSLPILIYISTFAVQGKQTLLQQTVEHNNGVYENCFIRETTKVMEGDQLTMNDGSGKVGGGVQGYFSDTERYRQATDCWKSQRRNTPDDLFLTVPKYLVDEGRCSISQSEDDHVSKARGGMYATDLACNFKEQGVYAPDYLNDMKEYIIESVGTDTLLGNFVILRFKESDDIRWYFGHTVLVGQWKVGDTITTGVRFGKADLSGATSGSHTHIELRRLHDNVWNSVRYVTRFKELALEKKRTAIPVANAAEENTYYFTHYDLGDVSQNDEDACTSADGKDSCKLHSSGRNTMALTLDIRNKLGIKFGDKAVLTGDVGCEGVYTITDEMACRFRGENAWSNGPCYYSDKKTLTPKVSNIIRKGTPYYIKGDLPGKPGGACKIRKL